MKFLRKRGGGIADEKVGAAQKRVGASGKKREAFGRIDPGGGESVLLQNLFHGRP